MQTTTPTTPTTPKVDGIYAYHGLRVRVVAVDSDPRADVWVAYLNDPDRDAMVPAGELQPVEVLAELPCRCPGDCACRPRFTGDYRAANPPCGCARH